jgi:hypothetical protein
MDVGSFLSIPENREAVKAIVSRVLAEVEPVEAEVAACYIEPLLDWAERGEVVSVDLWNEPGRFGNLDLLVRLIVPLVATAMARAGAGKEGSVTREELKAMIVRTRSTQGRRRMEELGRVINAALTQHALESEARRAR